MGIAFASSIVIMGKCFHGGYAKSSSEMTGGTGSEACPRCGCALLWNGRAMACIACSYISTQPKSEKRLPAAKSRKRDKNKADPSRP